MRSILNLFLLILIASCNIFAMTPQQREQAAPAAEPMEESDYVQGGTKHKADKAPSGEPGAKRRRLEEQPDVHMQAEAETPETLRKDLDKAIEAEDCEGIRTIIKKNKDLLEDEDQLGDFRPLMYAAWEGKFRSVKCLIELGANVHGTDDLASSKGTFSSSYNNVSLMHMAVEGQNIELIDWLWDNYEFLREQATNEQETPLLFAVHEGFLDIVNFLIEKGARMDAQDEYGKTILHASIFNRDLAGVRFIWNNYPQLRAIKLGEGRTPVATAERITNAQDIEIFKWLIENGSDISELEKNNVSMLYSAIAYGGLEELKWVWYHLPTLRNGNRSTIFNPWNNKLQWPPKRTKLSPLEYAVFRLIDSFKDNSINKHYPAVDRELVKKITFLLSVVDTINPHIFKRLPLVDLFKMFVDDMQNYAAAARYAVEVKPIDFDLIRQYIVRGAPITEEAERYLAPGYSPFEDAWQDWCIKNNIPFKPLQEAVREWELEYLQSLTAEELNQDVANAFQALTTIFQQRRKTGKIPYLDKHLVAKIKRLLQAADGSLPVLQNTNIQDLLTSFIFDINVGGEKFATGDPIDFDFVRLVILRGGVPVTQESLQFVHLNSILATLWQEWCKKYGIPYKPLGEYMLEWQQQYQANMAGPSRMQQVTDAVGQYLPQALAGLASAYLYQRTHQSASPK